MSQQRGRLPALPADGALIDNLPAAPRPPQSTEKLHAWGPTRLGSEDVAVAQVYHQQEERRPTFPSYIENHHHPLSPPTTGSDTRNIIVLGASFGGLSCAHHFLDYTIERLRITSQAPRYRLILVGPSTHIYWNIGAPRALVKPRLLKHDDIFISIESGFQRHRGMPYTFVQGLAKDLSVDDMTVTVDCFNFESQKRVSALLPSHMKDGRSTVPTQYSKTHTIPYHALIICTGSSAHSDLLSLHGPHLDTAAALNLFHTRASRAQTIVVCGGGTSGVEVAGQLATYLNYTPHFPNRRRIKTPRKITLITGGSRCLPALDPKYGCNAEKQLRALGVEVIHGVRVTGTQQWFDQTGKTKIDLSDGRHLNADVYVPCTGVSPNSAFAPAFLRDEKEYILTNASTMRVDLAGPRVYCIGDAASYSQNRVPDVYAAVPVVMHNLLNDLLSYELQLASPYGGNDDKIGQLVDEAFVQRPNDSLLCPVTRYGGVGVLLGMRVPAFMVHVLKGHDYRVGKARGVVRDGGNPYAVLVTRGKYE